jgi:hypothetical protein
MCFAVSILPAHPNGYEYLPSYDHCSASPVQPEYPGHTH